MPKVLTALVAVLAAAQAPADLDRVIARLDEYLAGYEPKLSELIADEQMRQEVRGILPSETVNGLSRPRSYRTRRRLDSEVAFIALPDNAGWLGFRHVKTVDGKPVDLGEASLASTLTSPALEAARTLLNASAAHNLGMARTINLPNLPLEFLHARNRKHLLARADGSEAVRGVRTMRLVFLERLTPTLVQNPTSGGDMPSVIRAWVDSRGRLLRAEVSTFPSFESKTFENQVRVEFTEHAALGLLVPSEMREEFAVVRPGSGIGEATYSNFRRFQTSARIVPQQEPR